MISSLGLTVKQAGYVAAIEMTGSGLAALIISAIVIRLNKRLAIAGALTLFIICNLITADTNTLEALLSVRFITGISSGTIVATVNAIFAASKSPERSFSLLFMGNLIFGMIAFLLLPPLVIEHGGLGGVYRLLAGLGVTILLVSLKLPAATSLSQNTTGTKSITTKPTALLGLASMFIYFTAIGALWPFLEQIGITWGFEHKQIGIVLSASQLSGISGALLAAWLAIRFGRVKPIVIGTSFSVIALILFSTEANLLSYAVAVVVFYFAFIFTLVYLAGALAAIDPTGRVAAIGVTMQTAGLAFGPALASETIIQTDYSVLFWVVAGCHMFSLLLIIKPLINISNKS